MRQKPAGLRTLTIVGFASALLVRLTVEGHGPATDLAAWLADVDGRG